MIAAVPPYVVVAAPAARVTCAGDTVTRIEVRSHPPSSRSAAEHAVAATSEAVSSRPNATRESVILAYVRLRAGEPCTEAARRESERLLRAQRFIASAAVTAFTDGPLRVRIRVDVVEELPWVIGGSVRDGGIDRVQLGTRNFDGRGLTLIGTAELGGPFRPGAGLVAVQHGVMGRPAYAALEVRRRPLGGLLSASIAEPFLTDRQRYALHASFAQETSYPTLVRPVADDGAVRLRRSAYDVGWIRRVGSFREGGIVGLAGAVLIGTDVRTAGEVVIVTDSGLVSTTDTVLAGRYENFGAGRIAGMGGIRALRYKTVARFDALRAAQDIGTGFQASLLMGPSLWNSRSVRDVLVAGDIYAAVGGVTSLAALHLKAEGRRAQDGVEWDAIVGSGRLSWHRVTSERRTRILSVSAATVSRLVFPVQLTFRDPDGGLAGFAGSHEAGGRRAVFRAEQRSLLPWFRTRADFAVAAFADVGRLWAGDVPYGETSPVRSSVGISLVGAYPSNGKRQYRLDLAVPVNPESGGGGLAIRFSSADRTGSVWLEPLDVARARSATGAAALLRW